MSKRVLILSTFALAISFIFWQELPICLAQESQPSSHPASQNPMQFILGTINFFLLGFLVYYLIVLKPAQKREEDQSRFLKELKKDDEVVTSGGIIARVVQVTQDLVKVDIGNGVRLSVLPGHVYKREQRKGEDKARSGEMGKK